MRKDLQREIRIEPGYDRRDPDPKKNYGIAGCKIGFILTGEEGAVQLILITDWYPRNIQKEHNNDPLFWSMQTALGLPMPAGLGYHSPKPRYEDQTSMGKCEFLDGQEGFCDGSVLAAERVRDIMLEKGSDGVWKELEEYYESIFNSKESADG